MSFVNAIKKPYTNLKDLGIGLVVTLVPILNFATMGYALRCGTDKGDKLPDWSEFGDLWVKGLLGIIISLIWSIPYLAVMFLTVGTAVLGGMANPAAMLGALGGGMIITMLLGLLTFYFVPIAVLNYANNGFGAAFAFGDIFKKAFTSKWFVSWILALVAAILVQIVATVLNMVLLITIIGPFIVMLLAIFSILVTSFTLYGEGYK